jgi:hypothetical protein
MAKFREGENCMFIRYIMTSVGVNASNCDLLAVDRVKFNDGV